MSDLPPGAAPPPVGGPPRRGVVIDLSRCGGRRRRGRGRPSGAARDACFDGCYDVCDGIGCAPSLLSLGVLAGVLLALGGLRRLPPHEHARRPGFRAWPARRIRAYQLFVSARVPMRCALSPTCSQYALIAFDRHPARVAARLARARLMACRAAGEAAGGRPADA